MELPSADDVNKKNLAKLLNQLRRDSEIIATIFELHENPVFLPAEAHGMHNGIDMAECCMDCGLVTSARMIGQVIKARKDEAQRAGNGYSGGSV